MSRGLRTVRTGNAHPPPGCCAPETQGSLPRAWQVTALWYARRTRTSPGRAVRTAYRGTKTPCKGGDNTRTVAPQVLGKGLPDDAEGSRAAAEEEAAKAAEAEA